MKHQRLRTFNAKETYPEQNLVQAVARSEWLVEIDATAVMSSGGSQ